MLNNNLDKLSSIEKISLPDKIAEEIRNSIIDGSIKPGTRLLENDLSNILGVSRGPLREALRTLQEEGLVETIHHHGSYVAQISKMELQEIYSIRDVLECFAVKLVIAEVSNEQINDLEALVDETMKAAKEGDYSRATQLDFQWHQKIWELSNHSRLRHFLSGMESQIRLFLIINAQVVPNLVDSVVEHKAIMDAIAHRDKRLAVELMKNHIQNAEMIMMDYINKQEIQKD